VIDSAQSHSILSDIAYHDYLVLVCYMDEEWSRRGADQKLEGHEPPTRGLQRFIEKCRVYRDGLNRNCAAFCRANHLKHEETVRSHLYNPISYFPFGHADSLGIVLLDDFDPVHYLTSDIRTTVEEVCLAVCPKLESFCPENIRGVCCELHDLLDGRAKSQWREKQSRETYSLLQHEFQDTTPLLVFTKYKMDGLAAVGQSLLFQQALFKAMAIKIQDTFYLLKNKIALDKVMSSLVKENEEKKDITSVKCVFLDLQGPEEVGTLFFCSNYSVALTFVAALRSLTFGEVYQADKSGNLESVLSRSKVHRSIIRLSQKKRQLHASSDIDLLRDNHMFLWTHTSLAISMKAFQDPQHSNCNGYVEAVPEFLEAPGHSLNVEDKVLMTPENQSKGAVGQNVDKFEYHRLHIGVGDLIFPFASSKDECRFPLLALASVISLVRRNLRMFGFEEVTPTHGRDVVDILTSMVIPVPKIFENSPDGQTNLIFRKLGKNHFPPLIDILPQIQQRLCYSSHLRDKSNRKTETLGPRPGKLDLFDLMAVPRTYGIPVSLRRTIEYLFQDFATLIADPWLFDMILDLYDTFATLHAVLTKHLPSVLRDEVRGIEGKSSAFLDQERTEALSMLVDAIQNALMHRILRFYPEVPIRDMAIDFRGGMNQILHAVDAPVKCGLGLLRKYALSRGEYLHRDSVGGLTRVGFVPGIKCHSLNIGTESDAKLIYFDADVPHIMHFPSYFDYLHESFHIIYDTLRIKPGSYIKEFRFPDLVTEGRVKEVFAVLMSHLFIFGSDKERFLYYHSCSYSESPTSFGRDDSETILRLTETLMRLFLVTDAIPSKGKPRGLSKAWIRKNDDINSVLERFKIMVREFGPLFSEYRRLWEGSKAIAAGQYLYDEFKNMYPQIATYMPAIWSEAIGIYKKYVRDALCYEEDGTYKYNDKEVRDYIEQGLREGRPLIRCLHESIGHRTTFRSDRTHKEDIGMDALLLVCCLLREYIPSYRKNIRGKAIHLYRSPKERHVEYPDEAEHLKARAQRWYEFQLDRGAAEMFCPVPSARCKRLRKQIVMLKTFWDISSGLREGRLWEILCDNWPKSVLFGENASEDG